MDNLLHHPLRVTLTIAGFLCALSALTFFGGAAPAMVLPYIPIIFQFIGSPRRSQVAIGWLMLTLLMISFCIRRIEIESFQYENFVTYGGMLLLLVAGLHLFVSQRKNRINDAK